VGSNTAVIRWSFEQTGQKLNVSGGIVEIELYRATDMSDIAREIAGDIIDGINRAQAQKAQQVLNESLNNLVESIRNDPEISPEDLEIIERSIRDLGRKLGNI
jgi:uncharacterized lipoprotein YajG